MKGGGASPMPCSSVFAIGKKESVKLKTPLLVFLFISFLHVKVFPNSSLDIELGSRQVRDKKVYRRKGIGDCSLLSFFIILFPSYKGGYP